MRAFAVVMMIQGHTIDALLSPAQYNPDSVLFRVWQIGRGLTAPIFLFGSGFAYVIATARKSGGGRMPLPLFLRRVRWIAVLFLIGALMHFPASGLMYLPYATEAQWHSFFQVDVLRLMAVTLFGLLMLMLVARQRQWLFAGSLAVAAAIVGVTPLMHATDWASMVPRYLAGFLNMQTGSFFPIFPFSAYLFMGAAGACFYLGLQERGQARSLVPKFALLGAGSLAITAMLELATGGAVLEAWHPGLFFMRLGLVLLLWSAFGLVLRTVSSLPRIVPVVGQHTLLIYTAHIIALYGCPWMPGLRTIFGANLSFPPVLAVIGILLVGSFALAQMMHSFKQEQAHVYRFVPYAGMAIIAFAMIAL